LAEAISAVGRFSALKVGEAGQPVDHDAYFHFPVCFRWFLTQALHLLLLGLKALHDS
jgi:hypothetical protein